MIHLICYVKYVCGIIYSYLLFYFGKCISQVYMYAVAGVIRK